MLDCLLCEQQSANANDHKAQNGGNNEFLSAPILRAHLAEQHGQFVS
jgi:hypothetical protein